MSKPSVLIVDDEPSMQLAIEAILVDQNYELHFASSGLEGLQMARELLPDVILLDLMMPGMDGLEVCKALRQEEGLAEVPILIVTALDEREVRLNGLQLGADDYLTKPIDRSELRARLRTITRLDRYRKLYQERQRYQKALSDLEQTYNEMIECWTRAVDLRDQETQRHSQRVTVLTLELARAAGVPEDQMKFVYWGALLHDLGKLFIPDSILNKAGPLTDEERAFINQHPVFAYQMLSPIAFLRPALDIPYCHHERWDGSGYPRGLKGEEIPLFARIFAIVDVWDALTTDRPYRAAFSEEQTRQYIQENAGSHFDPWLVDLFWDVLGKNTDPIRSFVTLQKD